jgi:hypothetical protein
MLNMNFIHIKTLKNFQLIYRVFNQFLFAVLMHILKTF